MIVFYARGVLLLFLCVRSASLKFETSALHRQSTSPIKLKTTSRLIESTDIFIFDCDGVIWKGDTLIEGASQALNKLRLRGKKILFLTNNSTKSRKGYFEKASKLGLDISASGMCRN